MLGKYSDIIIELRNSIAKTTCDKFIFHLPIVTAFNNSFFQSSETIRDLKALFFKTLFVSDNENLKINSYEWLEILKELRFFYLSQEKILSSNLHFQKISQFHHI